MLEPEKPGEGQPDPNNPNPLKDQQKPGMDQQNAPDEPGLSPKDTPAKE